MSSSPTTTRLASRSGAAPQDVAEPRAAAPRRSPRPRRRRGPGGAARARRGRPASCGARRSRRRRRRCPRRAAATVLHDRRAPGAGPRRAGRPSDMHVAAGRATTWSAPSRSALLTTKTSAISRMPALAAWMPSPMPGREQHQRGVGQRRRSRPRTARRRRSRSARRRSRRRRAPAAPAASPRTGRRGGRAMAIERMNTPWSVAWSCMRTRSPSSAPPENGEDGSTASTPTRLPCAAERRDQRRGRRRLADAGRAGQPDDLRAARCTGPARAATSRSCGDWRPRPARSAARPRAARRPARASTRSATSACVAAPSRDQCAGHRAGSARRPDRRRRTARPRRRRRRGA